MGENAKVRYFCAATCGGDSGTSSTTTTTTTSSFGPSDIFDSEICAQWKRLGYCWENAQVRYLCAATCEGGSGTSSTTTTTTTTTTSCEYRDIYDWQTCADLESGWCKLWYYNHFCAATCNC